MRILSCAYCSDISRQTLLNTPALSEDSGVYWYYTPSISFGFSVSPIILQNSIDSYNSTDETKLSWSLDSSGNSRLGSLINSSNLNNFQKVAFIKDLVLFDCPHEWLTKTELACKITQNYEASLSLTISFGNSASQKFNTSNQITVITVRNTYETAGNHTIILNEIVMNLSIS